MFGILDVQYFIKNVHRQVSFRAGKKLIKISFFAFFQYQQEKLKVTSNREKKQLKNNDL